MRCLRPIPAARTKDEVRLHPKPGFGEPIGIPCGNCLHCKMNDRLHWALRARLEASQHEHVTFGTFTLNREHLTKSVEVRHLQLFYKRLRRELENLQDKDGLPRKLRHFSCGEYGEENKRPHYHAILYGIRHEDDRELLEWCWSMGRVDSRPADIGAIHYVVGYQLKKLNAPEHAYILGEAEELDRETGEIRTRLVKNYWTKPPFRIMSKKPGIGAHAKDWRNAWRTHAVLDGMKLSVPRFYRRAWEKGATEEEKEIRAWELHQQLQGQPHAHDTPAHAHITKENVNEHIIRLQEEKEREIQAAEATAEARLRQSAGKRHL